MHDWFLWVLCRIPRTEQAMTSASFLQLNLCSCAGRSASGLMKMTASWWDIVCFITLDRFPYIFFILINSEKVQWKRFQFQREHINMFLLLFEVLKFILYIYCRWKNNYFMIIDKFSFECYFLFSILILWIKKIGQF